MSSKKQRTLKSLAMKPNFERKLAAVNGIVISKIPQGGRLYKKKNPWTVKGHGRGTRTMMTCSICDSAFKDLRTLRSHFVTCVQLNGNPNGACWDDCLTRDDANFLRPVPGYAARKGSVPAAALSSKGITEVEERIGSLGERLAAVNGIVIPSKVSAGRPPDQGRQTKNGPQVCMRQVHPCIICDRKFTEKNHVRTHFITCVKRNGNPTGARWDDGCNGSVSPAGHTSTLNSATQNSLLEEFRPGDNELGNIDFDGSEMDDVEYDSLGGDGFSDRVNNFEPQLASVPPDGLQPSQNHLQQIDPQLTGPQSSDVKQHDPQRQTIDPRLMPSPPYGLGSYDPQLQMEMLTDHALIAISQAWQECIYHWGDRYALSHPHFQDLMKELGKRNMMSVL